ncbi:MAG: hypothetical protein ACJAUH_001752, partial [Saprospiraceae bacterium]
WQLWYAPWYSIGSAWNRLTYRLKPYPRTTYGYITTNKPKYLPQDTVKIKAYLTNNDGRPYHSELILKITDYRNFQFSKIIEPTTKGSYIFEFPLGDSLQLDRQYQVEFWKGKKKLMQTYFNYEDYQLDEISYTLRSDKKGFKRYEPILLYAEGKDKNGQNVMDGDVEITAMVSNIRGFYDKIVLVPDTLFHYKGALELGGEMRFLLPKETIPNIDFSVFTKAVFTNSNGELHEETLNFDIISDSTLIDLRLDGDTLLVDYRVNGKSVSIIGKLSFGLISSKFTVEKTVQLPYKEVLNPVFEFVSASANSNSNTLNFSGYENDFLKKPIFDLVQTGDSIFVFAYNPSGLEVNYKVYRINRKIKNGSSNEKMITWKAKTRKKTSYRIDYEYIINGTGRQSSQNFNYAENQLTIEIDQPNIVQPGETIDIKVKVKTSKNKNAKNVNLVAGAVNTQFGDIHNWKYKVPFIGETSKSKPTPYSDNYNNSSYQVLPFKFHNRVDIISENYRKSFDLDRFIFYKLLFADNGSYQESWNIESDSTRAQFAPFVVKSSRLQPIYLIYANRQLVHYHDTKTDYSFKGRIGYNQITIRGLDFELRIDSVYLKRGEKLVFSIDLENLPKNTRLFQRKPEWTNAEKSLLQKSIFTYKKTGYSAQIYVWQNDIVYPYNGNEQLVNFGPFEENKSLNFIRKEEFKTKFLFESKFSYEIEKTRERLYYNERFPLNEYVGITDFSGQVFSFKTHKSVEDTLFFIRKIEVFSPKKTTPLVKRQLSAIFKSVKFSQGGKVRYQISGIQDSTHYAFVFVNNQTNKKYFFNAFPTFRNLAKGDYTYYGYSTWGNYFINNVEIRNDTLLYESLEKVVYKADSNLTLLRSIMAIPEIILPIENPKIGQVPSKNKTKYSGKTYSVSGMAKDEQGEALIGATILIKGTKIGTITDLDGQYSLEVPIEIKNPILICSYVGFSSIELEVSNAVSYNIQMLESQDLSEVVVVGYDAVKRSKVTSSIRIQAAEIQNTPIRIRGMATLQGEVAGVSVMKIGKQNLINPRSNETDYYIDGITIADTLDFDVLQASSKIRSRFQDYAFWQPNLITDRNGEVTFRVTYPDDITAFQTFVLGMDRKQNFGIATKNVQSKKVALAQLAVPRFLIQGDKANIIGKSLNYSSDSLRIKSSFILEENVLKTNNFWLKNIQVETAEIIANTDKDTLQLTYKMEHLSQEFDDSKFFDGEKRPIPIYRKGVKETLGSFNILTGDTTIILNFDKDKGNVKIYAQTDILEVLLNDIQYLIHYPYGCNEQTASRLVALLMNDKIQKLTDRFFVNSKAETQNRQDILKMVKRLEEAQNIDGSWGWWRGNSKDFWMTNYVLKALNAADTSGYKTESYEIGLRFITNSLPEMNGKDLLNAIELLSDIKQNMDYEKYLIALDSQIVKKDIYNQLILTKIKQQQDLPYDLTILDSLEKQTLFGNIFYDIDRSKLTWAYGYRYWYSNHYNLTQLAYQILRNESENTAKLAAIRGYFLEKRTSYGWRNTFTTAQILSTILPDMATTSNRVKPKLVIKGNTTQTGTKFPFETTFYANTPLEIQKTGTSTIYLTGYQQLWNEQPKSKNDIFELKSKLIQKGKVVKKLESKTATKMIVTLEVKQEADYIMVEVPIPAGCSYGEKSRNYGWYGREVHREYFREKTCVFYRNLSVGTYTIEINLEPRFTGEYTLNPAKAEQMYFPVFYGRSAIKEVTIED